MHEVFRRGNVDRMMPAARAIEALYTVKELLLADSEYLQASNIEVLVEAANRAGHERPGDAEFTRNEVLRCLETPIMRDELTDITRELVLTALRAA